MNRVERAEQDLGSVRTHLLRGEIAAAQAVLTVALGRSPHSIELRRAQAGIHQQCGRVAEAESLLWDLVREAPGDAAAAFGLARILQQQGRMAATAQVIGACVGSEPNCRDANLAISAIELLDACGRQETAAAVVHAAIAANPDDSRLHAYAGMLEMKLGRFQLAREHYLSALCGNEQGWEWHVPIGLAFTKRYAAIDDPDLALFREGLQREGLSALARAELCFALGKADDDLGRHAQAAQNFRKGNAIARDLANRSGERWKSGSTAWSASEGSLEQGGPASDFTPIFIVGVPRSGTTLLAELLSRNPSVCNRGELPWIDRVSQELERGNDASRRVLENAAATYRMQCRQDDAGDARWFVDKQPLNFRHIDLMLALFPHARIVYCRRNPRDTALSLWMQLFADEALGFSCDFAWIARVMSDCGRLMAQACGNHPSSIHTVQYEALVRDPERVIGDLAAWLGLPDAVAGTSGERTAVGTSSLWQVRQPIYRTSVERWRYYAPYVPELLEFPEI